MSPGVNFIFGEIPKLPVKVPVDVTYWHLTGGPGAYCVIVLKRRNRWERWYCTESAGHLQPGLLMDSAPKQKGAA